MVEMRTVYRYEDALGVGPYNSTHWAHPELADKLRDTHMFDGKHIAWFTALTRLLGIPMDASEDEFSIDDVTEEYLSGADSREALDAWFDGWQTTLEDNGFKVAEYTVPADHVVTSRTGLQIAFRP